MSLDTKFNLQSAVSEVLSPSSSFAEFAKYFMWLTLKNGGCSKMASGTLSINYGQFWEEQKQEMSIELGGYDCLTMSRHHVINISAGPFLEDRAKIALIDVFEKERQAMLEPRQEGF